MRTRLLHPDRDLVLDELPEPDPDLLVDLELERLFAAMAGGDEAVRDVVRRVVALGEVALEAGDPPSAEAVRYRQRAVADALAAPATIRELHRLAADAVDRERRVWGGALRNAELVLRRSVEIVEGLLESLAAMRDLLVRDRAQLRSSALLGLADRLAADVDDAFLAGARAQLARLAEPNLLVTAGLGEGNRPARFVLRRPGDARARLRDWIGISASRGLAVDVALHDQNAMNALGELRAQAVAPVAGAVAEAADQLLAFCRRLRDETGFLVGAVNLAEALESVGVPLCTPEIAPAEERGVHARGIVDPCLALAIRGPVVGNEVDTRSRPLTVVTGANGGGKSTLLRAVGAAHLLLAAGLPVPALSMRAPLRAGVLAHFPRGEAGDDLGRLDAELRRLRALIDRARPDRLVLLNEPLSSVNERDGAAILTEVVRGLVEGGVEVWLVTHHHELAVGLHASPPAAAQFLRAERGEDGQRPFLVRPAPPLATAFGRDLWAAEIEGHAAGLGNDDGAGRR